MTVVSERPAASDSSAPPPPALPPVPPARARAPRRPAQPPDPNVTLASYALSLLSFVLLVVLVQLTLVSQLQHFASQKHSYDELRLHLAEGSVPIGQQDITGALVEPGTAMALLEIPEIGVREVVVEGTSSQETRTGVGHRRDTPLPGQPGVSVLMGRSSAYGAVFGRLDELAAGDTFKVTTGQGVSTYEVIGARIGETSLPVLGPGDGRLTLITAAGRPFMPNGVLRVDAELTSESFTRPPVALAAGNIEANEEALSADPSVLFTLSWLLEALLGLSLLAVWAWKKWGHRGTWIALGPPLVATAIACADRFCALLPNLI